MNGLILYREDSLKDLDAITTSKTLHRIRLSECNDGKLPADVQSALEQHPDAALIISDVGVSESLLLHALSASDAEKRNKLVILLSSVQVSDVKSLRQYENLQIVDAVLLPPLEASGNGKLAYCTSSNKTVRNRVQALFTDGSSIDLDMSLGDIDMFNKLRRALEDIEKIALLLAEDLAARLKLGSDLLSDVLSHAAAKSGPAQQESGLPSTGQHRREIVEDRSRTVQEIVNVCEEKGIKRPFLDFVLKQTQHLETSALTKDSATGRTDADNDYRSWDFSEQNSEGSSEQAGRSVFVFGLGLMGLGIAKTLSSAFKVSAYDPDDERVKAAKDASISCPSHLEEALNDADYILFVAISDDQVLQDIDRHQDTLRARQKPVTVVSNSTISSTAAEKIRARLANINPKITLIVSPMSGGPPKTENGGLIVLAGGERRSIEEALPFYKQISGRLYHVGEHADAVHMKSIHQVVGLSNFLAGVEIMQIGRDYGFDSRGLFDALMATNAWNGYLMERWPAIEQESFEPEARLSIWLKDLGIVKHELHLAGQECPWVTDLESAIHDSARHLGSDVADTMLAKQWPGWVA